MPNASQSVMFAYKFKIVLIHIVLLVEVNALYPHASIYIVRWIHNFPFSRISGGETIERRKMLNFKRSWYYGCMKLHLNINIIVSYTPIRYCFGKFSFSTFHVTYLTWIWANLCFAYCYYLLLLLGKLAVHVLYNHKCMLFVIRMVFVHVDHNYDYILFFHHLMENKSDTKNRRKNMLKNCFIM